MTGAFPRSEKLVEVTRAAARGKMSQDDVEKVLNEDVIALVNLQQKAGLEFIVDGQLNWQDLFRPFTELFTGIRLGSLTRWFDNNTFYRKPVIVDKIRFDDSSLDKYFKFNFFPPGCRKKAILPGPYSFAKLSENLAYSSLADLVDDLAHSLRAVVNRLSRSGYEYFQFNEPYVCNGWEPDQAVEMLKSAIEICANRIEGKSALHTYFGDASVIIDSILGLPVDCVGIDFYSTPVEFTTQRAFDKELGCGCIDGRNSLLETRDSLMKLLSQVNHDLKPKRTFVCPNCDLDFLPRSIAEKKVELLSEMTATAE